MDPEWNDSQPIYRQIRDRVVAMMLDGLLKDGDPLPSVRNVASEYRVNPLTVLKAYQQLADEQLVEDEVLDGMSVRKAVAMLAGLSQDQAEAVALRVIAGLDTPAVASILGKSPGAVRVALHRGLRALAADPRVQALAAGYGAELPGQDPGLVAPWGGGLNEF